MLVAVAVAMNVGCSLLAGGTGFPLYMDSFATIAVAAVAGLAPSLVVAVLTNGTLFLMGRLKLIFILCQLMTALGSALVFGIAKKRGEEKFTLDSFMNAGILSAVTNGIFGSLFAAAYHYNLTAIEQGIFFVSGNVIFANLAGGFLLNLADKALASFIAYGIYLAMGKIRARDWSGARSAFCSEEASERSERTPEWKNGATAEPRKARSPLAADAPKIKINPEYVFLIVAVFALTLSLGFKKISGSKFDRRYESADENRIEESRINGGFDSVAYASFALAAVSVLIMQVKLSRRKNQIKILNAKEEAQKEFSRNRHDGIIQSLAALKISLSQGENAKALLLADEAVSQARELLGL